MGRFPTSLLSALALLTAPLLPFLVAGCGDYFRFEPYRAESYKRLGDDLAVVNGVYVYSEMWPKTNVMYGERGPFSLAITFNVNRDSGKAAAIESLEVTSGGETLFAREFTRMRSSYFEPDSPGARGFSKEIGGARVIANGSLSFNFGGLFQIEHRPGRVVVVRAVVDVSEGRTNETRELVFRHRAKTYRRLLQARE